MALLIYGCSDDLVEIEGDISEEFNAYDLKGYLAISNGVLLTVEYTNDGVWAFRQLAGDTDLVKITPASDPDGGRDDDGYPTYSDMVTVAGDTAWVTLVKEPQDLARRRD